MSKGKNERIEELENELVAIRTWEKVQIEINETLLNCVKDLGDRVEKLESGAKLSSDTAKFCFNWGWEEIMALRKQVAVLEAAESSTSVSSIPAAPEVSLDTQPEPTPCTRTHVCGIGDPCNGYARTESWEKFYVLLTDAEKARWEKSDLTAEAIYNQRPKTKSSTAYDPCSTAEQWVSPPVASSIPAAGSKPISDPRWVYRPGCRCTGYWREEGSCD